MCTSTAITHAMGLGRGGRGFEWKKTVLACIRIICNSVCKSTWLRNRLTSYTSGWSSGCPVVQQAGQLLYAPGDKAAIGIVLGCSVVQWAGQFYIEIEFRLSRCALGWPVLYRDRVQAIWLCNRAG